MKKKPSISSVKSSAIKPAMILEKLPAYFLVVSLLAAFGVMIWVLRPFLTVLFVAAVLAITFYPVYRRVLAFFRGWARTASLFTCLFVVLVTVVPVTLFVILLADEGVDAYEMVQTKVESGVFDKYLQWEEGGFFYEIKSRIETVVDLGDIKEDIVAVAQTTSTFIVSQTANLVKSVSDLVLKFLIMLFALFYFFKDGDKIVERIGKISPLPKIHEVEFFGKVKAMVQAIMLGVFLTAIAQGAVGGIGFAIGQIPNPVFWGTAMAFFSLMPMIGSAVVWGPAVIILLILGHFGTAIFIAIWGVFVIGVVDNVLRPYLIGGKAHTYPMLTFFVILGGIWTMGFKGIIVGPLVLMVLMSFLHIYESEYSKVLKKH